jgi:hypothetical protein
MGSFVGAFYLQLRKVSLFVLCPNQYLQVGLAEK